MGVWHQLGGVLVEDNWKFFPQICLNGDTFRISYDLNWDDWETQKSRRIRLLLRFYYFVSSGDVTSKAIWLYPDRAKTLLIEPTPPDLVQRGYVARDLQIKRLNSRFLPASNPTSIPCTVSAEHL